MKVGSIKESVLLSTIAIAIACLIVASINNEPSFLRHTALTALPYALLFFIVYCSANRWPIETPDLIISGVELIGLANALKGLFFLRFPIHLPPVNIIHGFFENSGPFGGLMAITVCVAAIHIWKDREILHLTSSGKGKIKHSVLITRYVIASISLIICLLPLLLSCSRTAWISTIITFLIFLIRERQTLSTRNKIICLTLFIILFSLFSFSFFMKTESAYGRLHIWKIECLAILDNPLGCGIGYELGCFGTSQAKYYEKENISQSEISAACCPEYAFNEYLKFGIQGGVLCLIAVIISVVSAIHLLLRKHTVAGYGLITLSVFSLASYPLSLTLFRIIDIILFALALSIPRDGNKPGIIVTTLLLVILVFCTFTYRNEVRNAKRSLKALEFSRLDYYYPGASSSLETLYDALKYNCTYLYEYGYSLYKDCFFNQSISVLQDGARISSDPMFHNLIGLNYQKLKEYDKALGEYQLAHKMLPCRIMPLYLEMQLNRELGNEERVQELAKIIIDMPVNTNNTDMIKLQNKTKTIVEL